MDRICPQHGVNYIISTFINVREKKVVLFYFHYHLRYVIISRILGSNRLASVGLIFDIKLLFNALENFLRQCFDIPCLYNHAAPNYRDNAWLFFICLLFESPLVLSCENNYSELQVRLVPLCVVRSYVKQWDLVIWLSTSEHHSIANFPRFNIARIRREPDEEFTMFTL